MKTDCETDGSFYSTNLGPDRSVPASLRPQSGTILVTSHAPAFADTAIALQTLTYKAVPWSWSRYMRPPLPQLTRQDGLNPQIHQEEVVQDKES